MSDQNPDPVDLQTQSSLNVSTFIGWEPPSSAVQPGRKAPRLNHKKSRNGCQQCRARRVKCDETHPTCGSCQRHGSTCIWGRPEKPPIPGVSTPTSAPTTRTYEIRSKTRGKSLGSEQDPEESTERRLLELKLLHQYMSTTVFTMNVEGDPMVKKWSTQIPKIALNNKALLNSLFAFSALHLWRLEPDDPRHIEVYRRYLTLTLQDHQKDVANLNPTNAEATILTSATLRLCLFAVLQERELIPYTPPLEWMQMTNSIGQNLTVPGWKFIADDESSTVRGMILNAPGMKIPQTKTGDDIVNEQVIFSEENRQGLIDIMRRTEIDLLNEPWDEKIQNLYEATLSAIGSAKLAMEVNKEPRAQTFRRLIIFPQIVSPAFIALLSEKRPRALVMMAHYFALLANFKDFWWIGNSGEREVKAIYTVLPEEWRALMEWPLLAIANTN